MRTDKKMKSPIKKILVLLLVLVILGALALDSRLITKTYVVTSSKVSKEITLGLVTDYHSCDYGENQKTLVDAIHSSKPDVVLLGGDIIDENIPRKNALQFLPQMVERYPVYYVSGNHEYWTHRIGEVKDIIKGLGIPVLEGGEEILNLQGQEVQLLGIDDPEVGEDRWRDQLQKVGKSISKERFSILLSHRPERFSEYMDYDFDLILSGHAHGGQWRIPLVLNGICAPNQGFFPKYAGGVYHQRNSTMIVSRGLARETTRLPRIFNPPEYVVIKIQPK